MSTDIDSACPGGCNRSRRFAYGNEADYPAKREPWRCLKFRCAGCKQWQPWCNGAADETPELCDDCAAKVAA